MKTFLGLTLAVLASIPFPVHAEEGGISQSAADGECTRDRGPACEFAPAPRSPSFQDYAQREVASRDLEEFVGGSLGLLIVVVVVVVAVVLIVAIIIPW